jgi:hypothetical protein
MTKITRVGWVLGISILAQGCASNNTQTYSPTNIRVSHSVRTGERVTTTKVINNYNTVIERQLLPVSPLLIPQQEVFMFRENQEFCSQSPVFIKPVVHQNCLPYNDTTTW